jgi:uncharacterized membrane protein YedE/YeeE
VRRPSWLPLAAGAAGVMFGLGLAVSGMTRPAKVIGFLDVTGDWDPSLIGVMGGAVWIYAIVHLAVRRRRSPLLAESFALPTRRDIDARLVAGAAIFGVGWGLAGYCPGPALTSLVGGSSSALVFVLAMIAAMGATARIERAVLSPSTPGTATR